MYQNPLLNAPLGPDGLPIRVDPKAAQEHFEDFYEDVFEELAAHGELENLNVCDNFADHMVGNVYAKFRDEEDAARALQALTGRYYDGRPIVIEFSPVTDFREATCRQYEENTCNRGGYCNFMHLKPISRDLRRKLFGRYGRRGGSRSPRRNDRDRDRDRGRDRSRERDRGRGRSRSRERGGGGGGDRGRRETSEERRARIASWNTERGGDDRGGGGYGGY
ncbi:hypothetical protein HYH03_015136 [Edaphochlamys debaryana]|uniref:Uncharacterized protein n=1 Tax=Edaphochlamys debaryana TaxID=47281 RepID=A0A835XMQ6_9CHLO|nr:hypothetical protein HYH03_015136 [Edaphochlamys debaryana]|eukprot:KAG2486172.1 hypothetical protein HYH03_015136 [Edaphochlamys debaryana]